MNKTAKATYHQLTKNLGIEYYDAERLTEALHYCAVMVQTINEIQSNTHTKAESEVAEIDSALCKLAHNLELQLGFRGESQGEIIIVNSDPRGFPLKLFHSKLQANSIFENCFGVTGVNPFDESSD